MGSILTVVHLGKKSGIPQDVVQNSFAFTVLGAPTTGQLDFIKTALTAFYNTSHTFGGTAGKLMDVMSESISDAANAHKFVHYDITGHEDGSAHGAPMRTDTWSGAAPGTGSLPDECAAALSFHSDYGTDAEFATGSRPRARDRGRVFIGPLAAGAVSLDATTKEVSVIDVFRRRIAGAAVALRDDADTVWCVWSRKKAALAPVTGGWVDDAFDTQRRRGITAGVRNAW